MEVCRSDGEESDAINESRVRLQEMVWVKPTRMVAKLLSKISFFGR